MVAILAIGERKKEGGGGGGYREDGYGNYVLVAINLFQAVSRRGCGHHFPQARGTLTQAQVLASSCFIIAIAILQKR